MPGRGVRMRAAPIRLNGTRALAGRAALPYARVNHVTSSRGGART
jgi:hypothetical protein